jgi:cell wall-associated NlpC family hydrolase
MSTDGHRCGHRFTTDRALWLAKVRRLGVPHLQLELATAATSLLKIPYRHQGRNPAKALDCVGLGHAALRAIGYVPRFPANLEKRDYAAMADDDEMQNLLELEAAPIAFNSRLEFGDFLLFRWPGRKNAGHFALTSKFIDGETYFVHAALREGEVTEHPLRDEWRDRLHAVLRLRDFI